MLKHVSVNGVKEKISQLATAAAEAAAAEAAAAEAAAAAAAAAAGHSSSSSSRMMISSLPPGVENIEQQKVNTTSGRKIYLNAVLVLNRRVT